jgi:hypothetical protein
MHRGIVYTTQHQCRSEMRRTLLASMLLWGKRSLTDQLATPRLPSEQFAEHLRGSRQAPFRHYRHQTAYYE